MNKKKILAIVLVILVIILGGASIYVARQLSTREAVAPTAPESKPSAAGEVTWSDQTCVKTGTVTEEATGEAVLTLTKSAFKDDPSNVAGKYNPVTETDTVEDGETFVYMMSYKNTGTATVSGVVISDVLTGNNLDKLTYIDASSTNCTYENATRKVTCTHENVIPGGDSSKAFRVKVAEGTTDGTVIKNTVIATYDGKTVQATKDITVSNPVEEEEEEEEITLEGSKTAYKDVTTNTAGKYTLLTEMATVSKGQTYVYSIDIKNTSNVKATGVTIKDSLKDVTELTFIDAVPECSWSTTEKMLTCNTTLDPDQKKTFSFRVKASDAIVNGLKVSNTAKVTFDGGELTLIKDLLVSTVVGCNHVCTTDEECSTGLTCDTTANKCRKTACTAEEDCVCAVTVTKAVTTSTPTKATTAPTKVATAAATPTILPETGLLDLPGMAAFGGGLFLAVVGILLAL